MIHVNIIVDNPKPLLCDLPDKATFVHHGCAYVKHSPSGDAHYKCYNISRQEWETVAKCIPVVPCDIKCVVTLSKTGVTF